MEFPSATRLAVSSSRKHAVVERDANPTPRKIRERILANHRVYSGFELLYAPSPCWDDSRFLILGNDRTLLVGACFVDSIVALSGARGKSMADELEILFDPFDDGLGYVQFYFNLSGKTPVVSSGPHRDSEPLSEAVVGTHFPYPEAQSSAFDGVRLRRYRWWDETISGYSISGLRVRWLFAWFDLREVFRNGRSAGFNIARQRTYIDEFGTWNHASGNGSQDALSLGKLYKFEPPAVVSGVGAALNGRAMTVTGECERRPTDLKLRLMDPLGNEVPIKLRWKGGRFTIKAVTDGAGGRYRLKAASERKGVEPAFVAIDVPEARRARDFVLSLTYDPPDNLHATHYTPQRLDRDFAAWREQGIQRVQWIDYSNWPSFYWAGEFGAFWGKQYTRTFKECGNFLRAAVVSAHRQGLEFHTNLKTFDIGMNFATVSKPFRNSSAWDKLDNAYSSVVPEIAAARGATFHANPAWQSKPNMPVTRIVVYSDVEVPAIKPGAVKVFVSSNNRRYTPLRATVRTGAVQRRHQRWTPVGNVDDTGTAKNWYIEITGIKTNKPYLAIKIDGKKFEFWQRGFMFAEAFDADGRPCVTTPATSGGLERGFSFWKGWQGWNNQTEAVIQRRSWASDGIGLIFDEADSMPTLLEPAHAQARAIWLGRVRGHLAAGVDGVSIRTYCHHNGPMHYLKYAFAQPVLEAFRGLYGRDPRLDDADYEKIRNIRGDFYTQFIADASRLVRTKGKKFSVEVESGVEVPSSLNVRMQLPLQWRRWITDGLLDEIRVKWFSPWSVFVHEEILPLARRHGVPVHVVSRCMHQGLGHRFNEIAAQLTADTVRSGFTGYEWYEQNNFMELTQTGHPLFKGPVSAYFATVRKTLEAMS
ncbi:MAG: hypothetical protein K8S99_05825 [Planctomycetes bacterium]|nr:hypothetical protein [Planctomycetota bacterium]